MSSLMEVSNVTKWYASKKKKQDIKAVDGVSFCLEGGNVLGIIGESGCGKSTLGRLLVALEKPTSGSIEFSGEPIEYIIKKDSLKFRRNCQMIFQNPYDTFDPRDSVKTILNTALKIHGIGNSEEERMTIIIENMELAGIRPAEDYIYRFSHELSGGQLQRISIIRSMLLNPKLIVADEPVSMLDVSVRADIINLLLHLTKEQGAGMVFISHDIATTHYISDKIAVMYLGRIVETGKSEDIVHNPKHPYTKVLISNSGSINPSEKGNVIRIEGEPPTPIDTGPGCYFAPRCYKAGEDCKKSYPIMENVGNDHYASCFYLSN